MDKTYYEINEQLQVSAKQMWSFREYVEGSATLSYREYVDEAYRLADDAHAENRERAYYLADRYAKKLAQNINALAQCELMCPSIMICGGGNFPVKKKERQNERKRKLFEELEEINEIPKQIESLKNYTPIIKKLGDDNGIDYSNEHFKVVQNVDENRLQLFFDGKPDEKVRSVLKSHGYVWSNRNKCWQRQLTNNARASIKYVLLRAFGESETGENNNEH